jgi:hypothetical protein
MTRGELPSDVWRMFMEVAPQRNVTSLAGSCHRPTGYAFGDTPAARLVPAVHDATVNDDATTGVRRLRRVIGAGIV